ncbi:hypothetical protein ABZP36_015152 [Zizania latifolia]
MYNPPAAQDMSYYGHVQKRHEDKGCLYAWLRNGLAEVVSGHFHVRFMPEKVDVSFAALSKRASPFDTAYL